MKQLKAVIFDVDGTLAETERDGHRTAFNRAFKQAGLDWFWDISLYGELLAVSGGKERILYFLQQSHHTPQERQRIKADIPHIHASKTRFYNDILQSGQIPLRAGVARLIEECRQAGLKLAIATTTTPANVTALISHTLGEDKLDCFDVIAAGDVVEHKKPAPDIFVYCLQQLGLDAAQCIAIEDSANGLDAARAAGLATLVTPGFYTAQQVFNGAISVVDCLGDSDRHCQTRQGMVVGPMVTVQTLKDIHEQAHR